jgi:hypothetical protein
MEKKFSLGTIQYRIPNILERLRLFGALNIDYSVFGNSENTGAQLTAIASLIENIKPFVISIDCKKGDQSITTWDDALNHAEFVTPLSEIAMEIITQMVAESSGNEKAVQKKKR